MHKLQTLARSTGEKQTVVKTNQPTNQTKHTKMATSRSLHWWGGAHCDYLVPPGKELWMLATCLNPLPTSSWGKLWTQRDIKKVNITSERRVRYKEVVSVEQFELYWCWWGFPTLIIQLGLKHCYKTGWTNSQFCILMVCSLLPIAVFQE